jgi:hypothetical protein
MIAPASRNLATVKASCGGGGVSASAAQQRARPGLLPLRVERARDLERLRVEQQYRIQLRPLLVVGLDSLEIDGDELLGRQARGVGLLQVEDRRGLEVELAGVGAPRRSDGNCDDGDCGDCRNAAR